MRTIIAGMRDYFVYETVELATIYCGWEITEVVCGMAKGVDTLGMQWANEHKIPVTPFPAKWNEYGTRAGMMRNSDMALYAQALVAIWNRTSRGTGGMIQIARSRKLRVYVLYTELRRRKIRVPHT